MYYNKTKRAKLDKCNICLETKELSWDHVPPKRCSNHQKVEISSFFDKLTTNNLSDKPLVSQNGMKYRTICKDCNSLLGSKYDNELNNLVKTLISFVNSNLLIPPVTKLKVRPLPIIKSIVGHVLAAKKQLDNVKSDNIYREFVLDENVPVPDKLNLFYWIYPFENTIIMRDFVMPAKRNGDFSKSAFFQLLKFFPLAFLISDINEYEGLTSLTHYSKGITLDKEVEIPIYFNRVVERFWRNMIP
ncbi:hypothetical protein ES708_33070 [subsurface metagenome]